MPLRPTPPYNPRHGAASPLPTHSPQKSHFSYTSAPQATEFTSLLRKVTLSKNCVCVPHCRNLTADGSSVYLYDIENRLVEKRAQTNTTCTSLSYAGALAAGTVAAGSVTAQRESLRSKEKLDERDAARMVAAAEQERLKLIEDRESQCRVYDYLVSEHAEQAEIYRLAKEAGEDPTPRYPHPDDFIFDHRAKKATISGPWDETDANFFRRLAKQRDYHMLNYVVLDRQRPRGSKLHRNLALFEMVSADVLVARHQQLHGSDLSLMLEMLFGLPIVELRTWRSELEFWLKLNPMPELSKKDRRETYKIVNKVMKPYLKASGFKSFAQLGRYCEEEEEREKAGALRSG